MSGETETNVSGWTTDTLHGLMISLFAEHEARHQQRYNHIEEMLHERDVRFNQRFEAQQQALYAALASQQQAVDKAEVADARRFDSVNEFRGQLNDQVTTFISRTEVKAMIDALVARVEASDTRSAEKIEFNSSQIEHMRARGQGIQASLGAIVAGIGALAALIGIIAFVVTHK